MPHRERLKVFAGSAHPELASVSPAPSPTRGLSSSTFQLNMRALYGIGGACRGCVARVKGVLGCV